MNLYRRNNMFPQTQNMTVTFDLGCELNLRYIGENALNVEYKPKKFNGIVLKIREPRATALIFSTGKCVCCGTKSYVDTRKACRRFARMVQKLGFPVNYRGFSIQNIAASVTLNYRIDLEALSTQCSSKAVFEPELFPGLHYTEGKLKFVVFRSGKIIITGAKSRNHIIKGFSKLEPIFSMFEAAA